MTDPDYWQEFQSEMYEQNMYQIIEQIQENQLNNHT